MARPNLSGLGAFTPQADNSLPAKSDAAVDVEYPEAFAKSLWQLPLDRIEEDPDQPRKYFSEDTLKEMAQSLIQNGQLQAISVKVHPEKAGHYIINVGARRLRAAKLAGFTTLEAKIEDPATRYQQMAENLHRDNLTPLEIASFIEEQAQAGIAKKEIAKRLGKSPTYVSKYIALADSPDWIKKLSARGVCSDVNTLSELAKLDKSGSIADLENKVSDFPSFTRSDLEQLISDEDKADEAVPTFEHLVDSKESTSIAQEEITTTEKERAEPKEPKDPNEDITIWLDGRKGFVQAKKIKVYFDDTGEYEQVDFDIVVQAMK